MKQQLRLVALLALMMLPMGAMGQVTYPDATGEIDPGIATAGGTLDFTVSTVSHTASNLIFKFTVNGNTSTTDWGKILVGIATGEGSSTTTGNGWGRPINLNSPIGGMNYQIGAWHDGGTGAQLWRYTGSWALNGTAAYASTPGSTTDVQFTVSLADLGLELGQTIFFDAYTSGGGGTDGAIDAAARQSTTIAGWGDTYTSNTSNGIFSYTLGTTLSLNEGWRMMSMPTDATYAQVFSNAWLQGMTGISGNGTGLGTSNIRTWNGSAFASVAAANTAPTAGQGFLYYHFNDDNYDNSANGTATSVNVRGQALVSSTLNIPNNGWTVGGNPFLGSIDWDLIAKTGPVGGVVYVYDPAYTSLGSSPDQAESGTSTGNYRAWNGTAGSLTNGLISPFQAFWVESTGSDASISIDRSDYAASAGTFRGREVEVLAASIAVKGQGMQSEAFLEFSEQGDVAKDGKDAYKLRPLSNDYALLYTQLDNGTTLDINHLPIVEDEIQIPLGLDVTRSGEFELFLTSNSLPDEWMISVLDDVTGVETRLDRDTRYRFNEARMAKRGNAVTPDGPEKVAAATSPRFTLIIDPASSTSTEDDGRGTMDEFALAQNYPNPFNPSTQIRFALRASGLARLTVYDVLGREVAVLVNGALPAGAHSVTFDASNLTSGVYMYKLEAGGMVMTKRMTLVK